MQGLLWNKWAAQVIDINRPKLWENIQFPFLLFLSLRNCLSITSYWWCWRGWQDIRWGAFSHHEHYHILQKNCKVQCKYSCIAQWCFKCVQWFQTNSMVIMIFVSRIFLLFLGCCNGVPMFHVYVTPQNELFVEATPQNSPKILPSSAQASQPISS